MEKKKKKKKKKTISLSVSAHTGAGSEVTYTDPPSKAPSTGYWIFLSFFHPTLLASLFETFLQTLPGLVTYATEGAVTLFFVSAQLSTDAVSALRKVWIQTSLEATDFCLRP